ncbi:MAG: DUF2330 domain-containing protein [Phycisphaerae bacterium]|nr:DUF2330 domain-containing protein [Phycisphaerae bacterium]
MLTIKYKIIFIIINAFILLSTLSTDTLADGKHFPDKAYRTSPTIHSQRAILKYKDGQETLVIESSFNGEGEDFGWVIPLPAIPSEFKEASRGFLETLSVTVQPKIIHDVSSELQLLLIASGIVVVFIIITLFVNVRKYWGYVAIVMILLCWGVLIAIPAFSLAGEKGTPMSSRGVDVLDAQEVGSFGLVVLDADDAQVLDTWLEENDFTGLNATEQQIISDYIQEGWCFVAAKLKRDGEGYTEPHPLAMTFKTEKPIYPMRLTAAANSDVFLELFIIADQYASSPALTAEQASQYVYASSTRNNNTWYGGRYCAIGHPERTNYMWDKCVVTRLCDTLTPAQMKADIAVDLHNGGDYQKWYYNKKGAFQSGLIVGLIAWFSALLIFALIVNIKKGRFLNVKDLVLNCYLPAIGLLIVSWGIFYMAVDKIDASEVKTVRPFSIYHRLKAIECAVVQKYHENGFFDCKTVKDVEYLLEKEVFPDASKEYSKYITNSIELEASPGNITVHQDDRGFYIRCYRRAGFYEDIILAEVEKKWRR